MSNFRNHATQHISDIMKAKKELKWEPKIRPGVGVKNLVEWVDENKNSFS